MPRILVLAASWSWRLLLVGGAAYAVVWVLARVWPVVVPVLAAVLLAALLRPVTALVGRRLPGPAAAGVTLALGFAVLGGVGYLVGVRFTEQIPTLVRQITSGVQRLRAELAGAGQNPIVQRLTDSLTQGLAANEGRLTTYLTTGASYLIEFLALVVLTLFVTFFLLYDGRRIWGWLLSAVPEGTRRRVDQAGHAAWVTITAYVRGTAVIATVHGVVIGLVSYFLGVPLAVPIGALVFLGSFVPLIGALVAGGLAVVVAFGTQGWLAAVILLAVLVVENQLEAHLLQPLIVGRYVQLHPLAIGLALVTGTVLAGIVGALVAVPVAAVVHRALPELVPGRAEPEDADE